MPLTSLTRRAALVVAILTASACGKDSTPPLVATTVITSVASVSLDAIGATQVITVTVNDQNGAPMLSIPISWATQSPTVASVSGAGTATVTATGNGSGTVSVTAGTILKTIPVTVAQVAVAPVKTAGDVQSGTVGAALGTQLRVRVQDRLGNLMTGSTVVFAAAAGSGTVTPSSAVVGVDGTAVATWTLGTVPGAQSVTATAQGSTSAATFTATAVVGPPATIAVNAGNNQTATAGTAVATAPSVRVADAFNNPIAGVTVAFSVTAGLGTLTGASAVTNASGIATVGSWTLGAAAGVNVNGLTATVANLTAVQFIATGTAGPAAAMIVNGGNGQTALVATAVATAPSVRVNDANGNAVAGVAITFAVGTGGGTATGLTATTNTGGVATVGSWTLGPASGTNTLTATATGTGITGNPVTFTASGTLSGGGGGGSSSFRVELRFLTTGTATQTAAFNAAAARWQAIITGDLADVLMTAPAATCGSNSPAVSETIDDLVIFVTFATIDGVGGTLGSAGPCFVRNSNGLPVLGQMRFDVADLATMESNGTLNNVILHEMGHVIGIGTMWDFPPTFTLLANPSLPSSPGADTRFTGANGLIGFNNVGGTTYTGGGKVPVENVQGGVGTRDAHWREGVLLTELMTGFISASGASPLSQLTIRSLMDLGYVVDLLQADAFFVNMTAAALQAEQGPTIELKNDVIRDPIRVVDERGALIRVIRPREQ